MNIIFISLFEDFGIPTSRNDQDVQTLAFVCNSVF